MKKALSAVVAGVAVGLCVVGLLRHRPRRVFFLGGFRCERCGQTAGNLDEIDQEGAGYVSGERKRSGWIS